MVTWLVRGSAGIEALALSMVIYSNALHELPCHGFLGSQLGCSPEGGPPEMIVRNADSLASQ